MTCEKCRDIHEAQGKGLTNLPCSCSCHPTHICPTYYPPTNYPYWITTPTIWCQPNNSTYCFSTNNHTSCGSGCNHNT